MSATRWQKPRTAEQEKSVWRDLPEICFRQHLVSLEERTNAVPTDPEVYAIEEWQRTHGHSDSGHVLPIKVEQQIADDFAFLAAVEEGAQSVAAACIEENPAEDGMTIRFAAMDAIELRYQNALRGIAKELMNAANIKVPHLGVTQHLSDLKHCVLRFHRKRIIARLRSVKWPKPQYLAESHKKPLWKDFSNLIHRASFLYSKKESRLRFALQIRLQKLADLYESFEGEEDSALETVQLTRIIEESYTLCTSLVMKAYVQKLEGVRATSQVASAVKCVRQIEKVAAYQRIPESLLKSVEQYPSLFSRIDLQFVTPYASIPTSTSHESWARICHVHAEIQLVVHYDLHQGRHKLPPRIIGTSKYMCFLCQLFVKSHGGFFPASTHGRLYDQWTVPDQVEFGSAQIESYRRVIQEMDIAIVRLSQSEPKWRPEPMTSRQDLSQLTTSPLPWIGTGRPLKAFPYVPNLEDADAGTIVTASGKQIF